MTKAAILISAILLLAGVVAAGALTSTGGASTPTIDTPTLSTPTGAAPQGNRQAEDISGPCDEAEHANDPRCTGATGAQPRDDAIDDNDHRNSGPGNVDDNSGHQHGNSVDDNSGHQGSNSGPGGGGDDD